MRECQSGESKVGSSAELSQSCPLVLWIPGPFNHPHNKAGEEEAADGGKPKFLRQWL
jgi:hypothetical protein